MANLYSNLMTNTVASPSVRNPAGTSGGRLRYKAAQYTFDGTQSDGDVLRFFRVKSNAYIKSLELSAQPLTGMTSVDFGLYEVDSDTAVDDDVFDSAQTLAGALTRQEKRIGSDSALSITTLNLPVWDLAAGVTEDPGVEYDVCALINTSGSASGTVVLEMTYAASD